VGFRWISLGLDPISLCGFVCATTFVDFLPRINVQTDPKIVFGSDHGVYSTMPTQRRTSRRHQFGVLDEESQIEEERKQLSYGSARVDIDALAFDASPERQANERNIERLLSAFQRAGCLRLHPQYHVPAIIAKEQLDEAVANTAASEDALLHHDPSKWPILIFPDGFRVQCLHGRHRIEAAKRYLSVNDRWWVVDFYSPGE
jgi:hypothetical protein